MNKILKIVCIVSVLLLASCSDEGSDASKSGSAQAAKTEALEVQSPLQQLSSDGEEQVQDFNVSEAVDGIESGAAATEGGEALADEQTGESLEQDSLDDDYSYDEPSYKVSLNSDDSAGVIRWDAPEGIDYSNATVVIAGANGDTVTRKFGAGEAIELYGELPDGVYNWETVITPTVPDSVKQEMQAVRALGDMQAEKELIARLRQEGSLPTLEQAQENRQSGAFIVDDGKVRPSLVDDPNTGEGNDG